MIGRSTNYSRKDGTSPYSLYFGVPQVKTTTPQNIPSFFDGQKNPPKTPFLAKISDPKKSFRPPFIDMCVGILGQKP